MVHFWCANEVEALVLILEKNKETLRVLRSDSWFKKSAIAIFIFCFILFI